ncbi:hypothetical protein GUJ93_ZPchr0011g28907 [Zizania palustris]|uniref:Dirigent protein n=1 Tax=Zizania palustris TaxID=103762 RepID=A0A8J5WLL7_ZIZPA|nr:hypothetical protein GUJ93_ZPchr0011g28907 [Zizania palustris]
MAAASSSSVLAAALLLLAVAACAETKETRMRVFWHDVVSGPNSTVAQVAQAAASNVSATGFGTVLVIDDPLTEGPNLTASTRLLGRAQGMYVSAGKDSLSLLMAMNFVFIDGPYNGSSIAIFGPNPAERAVREMPVVGGTGVFRFAHGYCQARTHWFNAATGDATVEYNIHILHD